MWELPVSHFTGFQMVYKNVLALVLARHYYTLHHKVFWMKHNCLLYS